MESRHEITFDELRENPPFQDDRDPATPRLSRVLQTVIKVKCSCGWEERFLHKTIDSAQQSVTNHLLATLLQVERIRVILPTTVKPCP